MLNNHVQLIGHLGSDPISNTLDSGRIVNRISVATNDGYYKKGPTSDDEWVDITNWHKCQAWGQNLHNKISKLSKGSRVILQGYIQYDKYKNNEGLEVPTATVIIKTIQSLDPKTV